MKNKIRLLFIAVFCICIVSIFKNWFVLPQIIGGDWPYYSPEVLKDFVFPPLSWVAWRGNGLGGIDITYSLDIYSHFTALFTTVLHIPWVIVYKIFWFGLFLLVSIFSTLYLQHIIFPKVSIGKRLLGTLIFTTNTYILLVVSGGQMGYALGYALSPLVIGLFIKGTQALEKKIFIKNILITSISLGLLIMIDIRIAYMALGITALYYVYSLLLMQHKENRMHTFSHFFIPLIGGFLLNFSWIFPLILFKQNVVQEVAVDYTSVASLHFFSFADFSHAFSLLHPNWPENIFGKIYFLQPEFLILPLLAFSSMLFIKKSKTQIKNQNFKNNETIEQWNYQTILFFALLGLIGIFLAKGANDPFGFVYTFLFQHVPGFIMFRDPTKFYLFIALSYSVLIPFSLEPVSKKVLSSKYKVFSKEIFTTYFFLLSTVFLIFWVILIRQAVFGKLSGTFVYHSIPQEYNQLTLFLHNQHGFFRTVWFPKQSRFSYGTAEHPLIEAAPFFNATSSAELVKKLQQPATQQVLRNASVKYVIVPYDNSGEIFQKDSAYNVKEYNDDIRALQNVSWLKRVSDFGKIAVFQTASYADHFSLTSAENVTYKQLNTTKYSVAVTVGQPTNLIFSESYHPSWVAMSSNGKTIHPIKTSDGFMSFLLPQKGTYNLTVTFTQQKYYMLGFIISACVFFSMVVLIIVLQ